MLHITLDCINGASISNGNIVFLQVSQQNGANKMPWGPLSFLFKSRNALDDSVVEVRVKTHYVLGTCIGVGSMRDILFNKNDNYTVCRN